MERSCFTSARRTVFRIHVLFCLFALTVVHQDLIASLSLLDAALGCDFDGNINVDDNWEGWTSAFSKVFCEILEFGDAEPIEGFFHQEGQIVSAVISPLQKMAGLDDKIQEGATGRRRHWRHLDGFSSRIRG